MPQQLPMLGTTLFNGLGSPCWEQVYRGVELPTSGGSTRGGDWSPSLHPPM